MDNVDKQIETLKVMNKVDNLNLIDDHYEILKKEAAKFFNDYKETGVRITTYFSPGNNHIFSFFIPDKKELTINYCGQGEHPEEDSQNKEDSYHIGNVVLMFRPTSSEVKHISNLVSDIRHNEPRIFKDINHFLNSRIKHIEELRVNDENVNSVFWLFREEKADIIKVDDESRLDVIAHVFERKNIRYFLIKGNYSYEIRKVTPKDEKYNYIDKGRLFYNDIFFEGIQLHEIEDNVLSRIIRESRDFTIITPQRYNTHRAIVEEEEKQEEINDHYIDVIKKKLDTGFEQDGIKFSRHSIEYAGLKIESELLDIERLIDNIDFDQNLDFNNIFDQICFIITEQLFPHRHKNMVIHFGSFPIRLDVETKKSEKPSQVLPNNSNERQIRTVITNKYLVDNIRINKSEIKEVLRRAICFRKRYDYDVFLKSVNSMSLKLHHFLANGIKIVYYKDNKRLPMRLNIVREKGRNYVRVKDKSFKVRNSAQLFAASADDKYSKNYRGHEFQSLIKLLIDLFEIKADDVVTLIDESLKAYKEAEERAQKLLNETMKKLNIERVTIEDKKGFQIKGNSGKEYFVEESNNHVYQLPGMKYICIVEANLDNSFASDKLVTYLYALKNDSYLASDISTLNI